MNHEWNSAINRIDDQTELDINNNNENNQKNNPNKIVYVAKLVNEHKNYKLDLACYNIHNNIAFTTEIIEDVYMQVLRQMIQQICPKLHNQTKNASRLYKKLLSKKDADPQCNVVLNNNTSTTNHYELLFLVVNNYLSSQLVAQALTDDKTKE
ncbi:34765_t:CDS:2, partial [Gigaspora margarita]